MARRRPRRGIFFDDRKKKSLHLSLEKNATRKRRKEKIKR
jgi:hypothetical protein